MTYAASNKPCDIDPATSSPQNQWLTAGNEGTIRPVRRRFVCLSRGESEYKAISVENSPE
jgi:hypothetical protein